MRSTLRGGMAITAASLLAVGCGRDYVKVCLLYSVKPELRSVAEEHNLRVAKELLCEGRKVEPGYLKSALSEALRGSAVLVLAEKVLADPEFELAFDQFEMGVWQGVMDDSSYIALKLLERLENSPSAPARTRALNLDATSYLGFYDAQIEAILGRLLHDPSEDIRYRAACRLCSRGSMAYVGDLLALVAGESNDLLRRQVAHQLARSNLAVPSVVEQIKNLYEREQNPDVKKELRRLLGASIARGEQLRRMVDEAQTAKNAAEVDTPQGEE